MYEYCIDTLNSNGDALTKNVVSRVLPVVALNRRPTAVRKSREEAAIIIISKFIAFNNHACTNRKLGERGKNIWPP